MRSFLVLVSLGLLVSLSFSVRALAGELSIRVLDPQAAVVPGSPGCVVARGQQCASFRADEFGKRPGPVSVN